MRFVYLTMFVILTHSPAFAGGLATAQGTVKMQVVAALSIQAKTPLNFPAGSIGSEAVTIPPGDSRSAQFAVRGEPNKSFQIHLPEKVELRLNEGRSASEVIAVSDFASTPAKTGILNENGEQALFVGATRDKLRLDQSQGYYLGTYSIDIVY